MAFSKPKSVLRAEGLSCKHYNLRVHVLVTCVPCMCLASVLECVLSFFCPACVRMVLWNDHLRLEPWRPRENASKKLFSGLCHMGL